MCIRDSLFSTLLPVWFIGYVATTTSLTPLQHCIGCACQNVYSDFKVAVMAYRVLHGLAPANPYCRPTCSSPTSVIFHPFTPCSVIPSIHRWTALVSCCSIRSLELSATGHPVTHHPLWLFFVNALKHFYFVNRFLTFYCSFTVHAFVVSVIVSFWATLKNLDWLIDWT